MNILHSLHVSQKNEHTAYPLLEESSNCTCADAHSQFSAYLDGTVAGRRMQAIAAHLDSCSACKMQFADWRAVQSSLNTLGQAKPPVNLNHRLRHAITRERTRRFSWGVRLGAAWQSTVRPFVLHAATGFAACVVLVGGMLVLACVDANSSPVLASDEALGSITPPQYLYSASPQAPIRTDHSSAIIVQAKIDDRGRVYDYTITSAENTPQVQAQVLTCLLQAVFAPSNVYGLPVHGNALLTLAAIPRHRVVAEPIMQ
jgi:hypothetical protein